MFNKNKNPGKRVSNSAAVHPDSPTLISSSTRITGDVVFSGVCMWMAIFLVMFPLRMAC